MARTLSPLSSAEAQSTEPTAQGSHEEVDDFETGTPAAEPADEVAADTDAATDAADSDTAEPDTAEPDTAEPDGTDAASDAAKDDAGSDEVNDEAESEDGNGETGEPVPTAADGPSRGRWLASMLVCIAVLIAGIAYGAVLFTSHRDAQAVDARNALLLSTTREAAADLVTLRHNTADADVQRIRNLSTGDFQNQISDTTGSFSAILTQGQVDSVGSARQVALVSADDSKATTIAAVTSTVKNSETPEGQQRVYRMKLSLENHGGRWLVSNVEFVS